MKNIKAEGCSYQPETGERDCEREMSDARDKEVEVPVSCACVTWRKTSLKSFKTLTKGTQGGIMGHEERNPEWISG